MINNQLFLLPPNKKITLTVNTVNINKPAVSAGFINLMYIWQYQSKWLKLGKYPSNNNWVDLVDYANEKTNGIYDQDCLISFNYYSVFGYEVNFRLVIYSVNSLITNVVSKNVLNRYEQAIVSNLIRTSCNDDRMVKIELEPSLLAINNVIKLNEPTSIDFFAKITNPQIYENNQTNDKKSSSVKIVFEKHKAKDSTWTTIQSCPLLFKDHQLIPISCSCSFNEHGSYEVRARIILEKSWQIAPINSNWLTINASFNDKPIDFEQLKTIIEYKTIDYLETVSISTLTIKPLKWYLQISKLINNSDNTCFIYQKTIINDLFLYDNIDAYPLEWSQNNFLFSNDASLSHIFISSISYQKIFSSYQTQDLIVKYDSKPACLFVGLVMVQNNKLLTINDLVFSILNLSQSQDLFKINAQTKEQFEADDSEPGWNIINQPHELFQLIFRHFKEITDLKINNNQHNNYSLFTQVIAQLKSCVDPFVTMSHANAILVNNITVLIQKQHYLINKNQFIWKIMVANAYLDFQIACANHNAINDNNYHCFWIKLTFQPNYFNDVEINAFNHYDDCFLALLYLNKSKWDCDCQSFQFLVDSNFLFMEANQKEINLPIYYQAFLTNH